MENKLMNLYRFTEWFDNGQSYEDHCRDEVRLLIVANNETEAVNVALMNGYNPEAVNYTKKNWLYENDASSDTSLKLIMTGALGPTRLVEQIGKFENLSHYKEMLNN